MHEIITIRTGILLLVVAVLALLIIRSLRAHRLKERYVLLFVLTGVPFLVFAFWPNGIVWASHVLQIEKATLLILCVTIYFILTTFALLSIVSVQDRKINTLGQIVALMREGHHLGDQPQTTSPEADSTHLSHD